MKKILARFELSGEQEIIEDINTLGGLFNGLQFMISKCLKEYNVHFLICENVSALNSFANENWYEAHISGKDGLWLGSGISSQYRLTVNKKPKNFNDDIEPEFGFVIKNSSAVLVKYLQ